MPGVRELLDSLASRNDVHVALLTGNYQQAARLKLEYFDLWQYFPCGAFGDDAPERNRLLSCTLARVRECGGPTVRPEESVVIGDTPLDVACAVASRARSLAVATGSHNAGQLRASGADLVFQNLSDTDAVLQALENLKTTV